MSFLLSPMLISVGQTAAVLTYLMFRHPDAFQERRARVGYTLGFYLLLAFSQAELHRYISVGGMGSLPTLPFLALTWVLYAVFIFLWSAVRWENCCFVAFVLLLVDNCIWPLISSVSRMIWNVNYLYDGPLPVRLPFILLLSLLECALARRIRRLMPETGKLHLSLYDGILALMIVLPFLYIRTLAGQSVMQDNKSAQILMTVCCLVAVITLAAQIGRSSSEQEKLREEQMRSVLQRQQAMFEQKLLDADTINRKYHDMKNFLLYLRANNGGAELESSIEQLMAGIEPYGAEIATGSSVLDVILSEKLSLCAQKQIVCVPYLDGALLRFMKPLDLCTLVGNAMDNAIESCAKIADPARRLIHLHTVKRGETVLFTVRNTFDRRPELKNGLPMTTKADAANHGYGLRNMRYVTEQYGGVLTCGIEGEEFVLKVLLTAEQDTPDAARAE